MYFCFDFWFFLFGKGKLKGNSVKNRSCSRNCKPLRYKRNSVILQTTVVNDGKVNAIGKPGDLPNFNRMSNFRDKGLGVYKPVFVSSTFSVLNYLK
jgi:hypothetical protein